MSNSYADNQLGGEHVADPQQSLAHGPTRMNSASCCAFVGVTADLTELQIEGVLKRLRDPNGAPMFTRVLVVGDGDAVHRKFTNVVERISKEGYPLVVEGDLRVHGKQGNQVAVAMSGDEAMPLETLLVKLLGIAREDIKAVVGT